MKKTRLRNWVKYYLLFINCILILILAGDTEDLLIFTLKNIIGIVILTFNHYLLIKYTNLLKES